MQLAVVFCAIVAVALAAPLDDPKTATILRYENENIGVDGFKYAFETSDGLSKEETGELVNAGSEKESIAVHGEYKYTGPDGVVYSVTYVADENGFQPKTHLASH